jgi:hypothetical protein
MTFNRKNLDNEVLSMHIIKEGVMNHERSADSVVISFFVFSIVKNQISLRGG